MNKEKLKKGVLCAAAGVIFVTIILSFIML